MKSEVIVKLAVILPKSEPAPPTERTPDLKNLSSTSEVKSARGTPRKLPHDVHNCSRSADMETILVINADRLVQLIEHRTAAREFAGLNLDRTNTQGL